MSTRKTDITPLKRLIDTAEDKVENAILDVDTAAAELARTVGLLPAAHHLAQTALELYAQAQKEGLLS